MPEPACTTPANVAPKVLRKFQSTGALSPTTPNSKSPFRRRFGPPPVVTDTLSRNRKAGSSRNAKLTFVVASVATKLTEYGVYTVGIAVPFKSKIAPVGGAQFVGGFPGGQGLAQA